MKKFDYSFLKNEKISSNILSLLISIEKIQIMGSKNLKVYPKVFENILSFNFYYYQAVTLGHITKWRPYI